jgi:crotonobetainyl-CoA:carnitine CoA-transferase CaiB-like acyl-CoA transferase
VVFDHHSQPSIDWYGRGVAAAEVTEALWRRVGGEPEALAALDVVDDGPALPSVYRVTDAATATVAATTLAAARLWQERGGPQARARVGSREAAVAFRSERYLRLVRPDGVRVPMAGPDDRTGDYRTRDGWIRLHCNYPAHRAAVDEVLGAGDPQDWTAVELEEAVVAAGGAAAALRSRAGWASHPQGSAVARLPLLGRARSGSEHAPRLPAASRPLAGVRVLDLTRVIAGPVAGRILAAHGAQVLRVGADHLALVADLVVDTGFGKRFTHLDLRRDEGRDALRRLVTQADVVLEAFRPGALARLGFGPEQCAELRPGLIYVEISAWGQVGPWSERRGFDSLVQMACGIADEGRIAANDPHGRPRPLPAQVLDHATGFLAALGAIQGLRQRHAGGEGSRVQVSLSATAAWLDSLGRDPGGRTVADPGIDDVSDLLIEDETPYGRVSHVRPPGQIDGAPPRWTTAPQRPGADTPVWT